MSESQTPLLGVHHIKKVVTSGQEQLTILDDVSFELAAGDTAAVVGASGSGKSTLLAILAGLDIATEGSVFFEGEDLGQLDEERRAQLRSGRVGFVFQSFHLLPSLTALENVMLPLELAGRDDARDAAEEMLATVGLGERLHHYPQHMSGGEQQRTALARGFVGTPRILFADEPTGNLDHRTGAAVIDELFSLNERSGTALVLVTHDEQVASRCRRRFQLDAGRLREAEVPA